MIRGNIILARIRVILLFWLGYVIRQIMGWGNKNALKISFDRKLATYI